MERPPMILRWAAAFFCAWLPVLANAQSLPALYDVTGVAQSDVLNIRATPSINAQIIGSLDPGAAAIEIVAFDAQKAWGQLNLGETSGWASLTFLKRQPHQLGGRVPETARCFGTEPFWSFAMDPMAGLFSTPDSLDLSFARSQHVRSQNRTDRHMVVYENDLGGVITTMKVAHCSDGMSDRVYGWEIDMMLYIAGDANAQMFSGCCSISP